MRKIELTAVENNILHSILNKPMRELLLTDMMKLSKIMEKIEAYVDKNFKVIEGTISLEELEKDLCLKAINDIKDYGDVLKARIIFGIKEKLENAEKILVT